jgi:hypothetical protein
VRVAGLLRLQLAEPYVFLGARHCRLRAEPAVFGHDRRAQNGCYDARRCDACADFLPAYRFPQGDGKLAARAARSG